MDLNEWLSLFFEQLMQTRLLEYLAVGFGITEVLLAKRNHILLYPAGIISILLSMSLLFEARLYAETMLNTYYLVMSIYGWVLWSSRQKSRQLEAGWSSRTELITAILISSGGFALLYLILRNLTDSDVPLWDAFVAATAWAGMWLLAKRRIENWIFLNISNFCAIPLLIHKKLPMFAVLTTVLFIVAIFGYREWKAILHKKNTSLTKPSHV